MSDTVNCIYEGGKIMKLGVMNPVINYMPFEDALKYLHDLGVQCIEIGAGGYPGDAH